jgi:hypothetical protein
MELIFTIFLIKLIKPKKENKERIKYFVKVILLHSFRIKYCIYSVLYFEISRTLYLR